MKRSLGHSLLVLAVAGVAAWQTRAQNLTGVDVGTPTLAGSATDAAGVITIVGGGNDIWNNGDNFFYYYKPVSGAFDVIVRVQSLEGPDWWTKAELMAREPDVDVPGAGDPQISAMTTRTAGQNEVNIQWRQQRDGGSNWPGTPATPFRPNYPNTWLRLQRFGDVFTMYSSGDGQNWAQVYTVDTGAGGGWTPWKDAINLGLAVTAHNDADTTGGTAVFSDLQFLEGPHARAVGYAAGFNVLVADGSGVQVTRVSKVVLDGTVA